MKKIISGFLFLIAATTPSFGAITVSNVVMDSLRDSAAAYGNVWQGFLKYDVASDSARVWAWVELSTDNGSTWSQRHVHTVGAVGVIDTGHGKKVWWMVDGDKGPNCKLRVRVNSDPAYYIQSQASDSTKPNFIRYPSIYMGDADPHHCPIPIPDSEPYATLERLVNKVSWNMDLTQIGYQQFHLPMYQKDTWGQSAPNPLTIQADTGMGSFVMGMAKVTDSSVYYSSFRSTLFYRGTYFKVGGMEFAVISKNTEGTSHANCSLICQAIQDSLGIPKTHVLINVDHTHYADNYLAGVDSSVAVIRHAKAAAVPAEMAYMAFHLGPGFNFTREAQKYYTNGPADEKVITLFFRNAATQAPIGSWVRFTGHTMSMNGKLNLAMESRFGGISAAMTGGAGTHNVNDTYDAIKNPGVTIGTYDENVLPDSIAPRIAGLSYSVPDKMGVAWSTALWYTNGNNPVGQSFRLGEVYVSAFTMECPAEQQLFLMARMGADAKVMPVGYANGILPNEYIFWGNAPAAGDFYRQTETAIRCMNILSDY